LGKLILIRHGHTPLNGHGHEERLRSWLDVPLDEQGLQEAAETADRIANYPVTAIFSSDLRRARQTAEVLRQKTTGAVINTEELRPWNLGVFGGQLLREIIPFLNLLNERPDLPAPGGESFHQFYSRYSRRLRQMLMLAEDSPGCIVAVTHVRNLLAARCVIEDGDETKIPVQGGPTTGTMLTVERLGETWDICHGFSPVTNAPSGEHADLTIDRTLGFQ
jgi:broad specificity phosphatase PhoE